jgi:hypothetical protein
LKRLLLPTKAFERSARRVLGKNSTLAADLEITLELLLKAVGTHKKVY